MMMVRQSPARGYSALLLTLVVVGAGLLAPGTVGQLIETPLRCIVGMATHAGWPLLWQAGGIRMGSVHVPWSEDCTGIAYYMALPLVAAFAAWSGSARWSIARVVVLPLLLALLVNGMRVAAILAYRLVFAPEVESAQLHYLLGFIGLVPALLVLLPRETRSTHWRSCLHLSAALGLLCPHLSAPGGAWILIAAAVIAWRRGSAFGRRTTWWHWALWSLAAVWIASSQMESLWLAWLLACPWRGIAWHREPEGLVALACTVPLIAMQRWTPLVLAAVVLGMLLRWWRGRHQIHAASPEASFVRQLSFSVVFLLPYVSIAFAHSDTAVLAPPASLRPALTAKNSYEVHLAGQPGSIRADWIAAQGGGRHHTVQVCMAYRGEHLHAAQRGVPVFTDGRVLRREFFLFPDGLINDYDGYLRHTFWPGSAIGVHLIFSATAASITAEDFDIECRALAARIREHSRPTPALRSS